MEGTQLRALLFFTWAWVCALTGCHFAAPLSTALPFQSHPERVGVGHFVRMREREGGQAPAFRFSAFLLQWRRLTCFSIETEGGDYSTLLSSVYYIALLRAWLILPFFLFSHACLLCLVCLSLHLLRLAASGILCCALWRAALRRTLATPSTRCCAIFTGTRRTVWTGTVMTSPRWGAARSLRHLVLVPLGLLRWGRNPHL